jgi:hypothetical protein
MTYSPILNPHPVTDGPLATLAGAVTETAPANDTASSGLNGRLQRVAQRLTSLIGLFPTSLGTKTAANSLAVTLASDGQFVTSIGAPADASATSDTGTFSLISLFKRALGYLSTIATAAADTTTLSPTKAVLATDAIVNGTAQLTPKFAVIAASTSGNNTLVAAVASKKIRVLAYNIIGNGAVNAKFQTGAGGTDLTGLKYIAAAGGGICAPFNPVGWFETASGALLNLNLSGAIAVGGELVYVEV